MKSEEGESKSYEPLPAEQRPTAATESPSCEASSLTSVPSSERERQSRESTEWRTDAPETSTADFKPKPPKAVKKNQQMGRGGEKGGGGLRGEERGQRSGTGGSSTETRIPPGGRRRGGAGRERRGRVGPPQEYAPR